jgi:hypothetical protein
MLSEGSSISFSGRLADLLVSIGCTGFSPNPSIIYDRRDREVVCTDARWTQFQVGCGPIDRERGYDPGSPRGVVGLVFDHSTWTGLDMFRPFQCARVVITDRVARAIQGAGLRGYHLVPVEEYGKDLLEAINGPVSPARRAGDPPSPPPPPLSPADLEAAAPAFRLVSRPDPRARPRYDLLADAVVWPDEFPLLPPRLSGCVRLLWRSRTCRLIGAPIEHEEWWKRGMELFPEWIGFLPERTTPSAALAGIYREAAAILRMGAREPKGGGG